MEITKTLLINAACLLIPPVVVVLLLRHFFPRKIRWSAGVVALVDLVIFWTDISYYESVWLTLFFVVIQLNINLCFLLTSDGWLRKKHLLPQGIRFLLLSDEFPYPALLHAF